MSEKGILTRKRIRETAYRIFAEEGFRAVTMGMICEACGMSRGGVYRHYGSTREIFAEILSEMSEGAEDFVGTALDSRKSAKWILDHELDKIRGEMQDSSGSLSYAIYEYSLVCGSSYMEELNRKAVKRWERLLSYGMETGEFRQVHIVQMTATILYVYQGVRLWSSIIPMKMDTVDLIVDKIRQDIIKGE